MVRVDRARLAVLVRRLAAPAVLPDHTPGRAGRVEHEIGAKVP